MLFSTLNGHMNRQFWFCATDPFLPNTQTPSPATGAGLVGSFASVAELPLTFAGSVSSVFIGEQRPLHTTVVEPVISTKNGTKPGAQPLMYAVFGPGVAAGLRSVRI